MERSRLTLIDCAGEPKSGAPTSRLGLLFSASGSKVSSKESVGSDFLRRRMSTTLTVMRCSQVEKADSPRKVLILRKSWRKASCIKIFGVGGIIHHSQAESVDATAVKLIEKVERGRVARLSTADGFRFSPRNRFGLVLVGPTVQSRRHLRVRCADFPSELSRERTTRSTYAPYRRWEPSIGCMGRKVARRD